jgi:FkbM family methyltransferase
MAFQLSYSQRFEDVFLSRFFPGRSAGFYVDIGAGHPVYDNVSFAFYLEGWRGIAAEPNPRLAQLCRAVRPRDVVVEALVGASAGEATFFRVDDFHGFSTAVEAHAAAAERDFGKGHQRIVRPVVTLAALCEAHAPAEIDFLKVDVEGYEGEVLRGNDWERFRPKLVVVEALAPFSQAPAWDEWEPLLVRNGYSYAGFDSLNRYYVAAEARGRLAQPLPEISPQGADLPQFRNFGVPLEDKSHPDQALARMLARDMLTRLPSLDSETLFALAAGGVDPDELARPATDERIEAAWIRLFGRPRTHEERAAFPLQAGETLRDAYARLIAGDIFRAACGRISASYAW